MLGGFPGLWVFSGDSGFYLEREGKGDSTSTGPEGGIGRSKPGTKHTALSPTSRPLDMRALLMMLALLAHVVMWPRVSTQEKESRRRDDLF